MTALRQVLVRLNAQPATLDALPDTWLDESGANNRGCLGDRADRVDISRIFRTIYQDQIADQTDGFVKASFLVLCSETDATKYLERHCRSGWMRQGWEGTRLSAEKGGTTCITEIVQLRTEGVIPSNSFLSFVGMQIGVVVVEFQETYRWEIGIAKQFAIDDMTARLLRALEQKPQQPSSLAP